jgi:MTH538 TIR-like domain (DUF1863)
MSIRQIHVFISHSWSYSDHYDTLSSWIFYEKWNSGQASLDFRNYSVPRNDPIHNADDDKQLREAIYQQMALSHVIVIPTGMYANYSKWIQKEIEGAQSYSKPILAVNPWGQERKSSVVSAAASRSVGWNKEPLVSAIWDLYREKQG